MLYLGLVVGNGCSAFSYLLILQQYTFLGVSLAIAAFIMELCARNIIYEGLIYFRRDVRRFPG